MSNAALGLATGRVWVAAALLYGTSLVGCAAQSWELARDSSLLRDGSGHITVGRRRSGATRVDVDTYRIVDPARVAPGCTSFVVWLRPGGDGTPEKLGELKLRPGGDERTMNGFLHVETTQSDFDVFVTPEENAQVSAPAHAQVFWASVRAQ